MSRRPRIDPLVWQPPPFPDRARQATGPEPFPPLSLLPLPGAGPEDVVVDADGRLLTGLEDGRILRVDPTSGEVQVLGDTGGRPLGLEVLADGDVLVCDSHRGLLRLAPATGHVTTLVDQVGGAPMRFCSNAVAASDGTVYFSESTTRFGFDHWKAAILEHRGTGRVMRRTPDGSVDVLLDGLQFTNGLVLDDHEASIIVAETGAYRLTRLWLTGEHAGTTETVIDNLPGFPDNLSRSAAGDIWVAIANPRDAMLDRLHRSHPRYRKIVWALPEVLQPDVTATVWVMAVAFDGRVVHDLQGPGDRYRMVTGLAEHDGRLYLGSITERSLAVLDLGQGAATG
jgi:sugar lactone lactonase YvrE